MPAKHSIKVKEITQQQKGNVSRLCISQFIRTYLLGRKIVIVTNHRALVRLYSFKYPEDMTARWFENLRQLDFELKQNAGKDIPHAICLSKAQPEKEDKTAFIAALTFEENVQEQPKTLGGYFKTRTA